MSEPNSYPPFFEGTSPKECVAFVSKIQRRARKEGKHRDNEWQAVFAACCFVGDALYWYEELGENMQYDWGQLRPALMAKFGKKGHNSTTTSTSASTTLASAPSTAIVPPAAGPPAARSRSLVRNGRLKVLNPDGSLHGYLAPLTHASGISNSLTINPDGALSISFIISDADRPLEIQIRDASHSRIKGTLAIFWYHLTGTDWTNNPSSIASCCLLSIMESKHKWAVAKSVWKISEDGEFSVEYPKPDGSTERLQSYFGHWSAHRIVWLRPSRTDISGYVPVKIFFEDAI